MNDDLMNILSEWYSLKFRVKAYSRRELELNMKNGAIGEALRKAARRTDDARRELADAEERLIRKFEEVNGVETPMPDHYFTKVRM